MYKIIYYEDRNGREPVRDYIEELVKRTDKDGRIKATKILDYIDSLRIYGTAVRGEHIKHLEGDIWELRPIRDRILFAAWDGNGFILLHYFVKKTMKTPRREIDQAKRNLIDHKERSKSDEQ